MDEQRVVRPDAERPQGDLRDGDRLAARDVARGEHLVAVEVEAEQVEGPRRLSPRRGPRSPTRTSSLPSVAARPATQTFSSPSIESTRAPPSAATSASAASISSRRPIAASYG
jgi:hypothetical protein